MANLGYLCSISRWVYRCFSFPCRFILPFQQWPMPQMPARRVFQWLPAQYLVFLTAMFVDHGDSPHGFLEKKTKITTGSTGETSTSLPRNSWSQGSEAPLGNPKDPRFRFLPLLGNGKNPFALKVARHQFLQMIEVLGSRFDGSTQDLGRWSQKLWLLIQFDKGI